MDREEKYKTGAFENQLLEKLKRFEKKKKKDTRMSLTEIKLRKALELERALREENIKKIYKMLNK